MGVTSYLAVLLEAGASTKKHESADPRLIRYLVSIYPENAGVELLVLDIEDFRLTAKLAEPRLAVYLEEMAVNLDCALASKASESGKMIHNLQREHQIITPKTHTSQDGNIDEMNYTTDKSYDQNKKY